MFRDKLVHWIADVVYAACRLLADRLERTAATGVWEADALPPADRAPALPEPAPAPEVNGALTHARKAKGRA